MSHYRFDQSSNTPTSTCGQLHGRRTGTHYTSTSTSKNSSARSSCPDCPLHCSSSNTPDSRILKALGHGVNSGYVSASYGSLKLLSLWGLYLI
jgi:hypothetical protein